MANQNDGSIKAEQEKQRITFTRDYSVSVPRGEQAYVIPASEWTRIKRMVARIAPAKNWFEIAGSICAGIFVSGIFCLLSFAASKEVPSFARVVAWVATVCGVLLSCALYYLSSQQRTSIAASAQDVAHEMENLEGLYRADDLPESSTPDSKYTKP